MTTRRPCSRAICRLQHMLAARAAAPRPLLRPQTKPQLSRALHSAHLGLTIASQPSNGVCGTRQLALLCHASGNPRSEPARERGAAARAWAPGEPLQTDPRQSRQVPTSNMAGGGGGGGAAAPTLLSRLIDWFKGRATWVLAKGLGAALAAPLGLKLLVQLVTRCGS